MSLFGTGLVSVSSRVKRIGAESKPSYVAQVLFQNNTTKFGRTTEVHLCTRISHVRDIF